MTHLTKSAGDRTIGRPRDGLSTVASLVKKGALGTCELRLAANLIAALEDQGRVTSKGVNMAEAIAPTGNADPRRVERLQAGRIDRRRILQKWAAAMNRSGVELSPVVAILAGRQSLSGLDRQWRRRSGWARGQLVLGLRVLKSGADSEPGKLGS